MVAKIRRDIAYAKHPVRISGVGKGNVARLPKGPMHGLETFVCFKKAIIFQRRVKIETAKEITVSHGIPGIQFQCAFVLGNGFIGSPLLLKDNPEIIVNNGITRIETKRSAVLLNRFIHARLKIQRSPQLHKRRQMIRAGMQCIPEGVSRLGQQPFGAQPDRFIE